MSLRGKRVRWHGILAPLVALVAGFELASFPLTASERLIAVTKDGRRISGTLTGADGVVRFETAEGRAAPLDSLRWIEGRDAAQPSPRRPLRQFTLRGGTSFAAGWIGMKNEAVRVELWNGATGEIPLGAIESFGPPPGECEVLFDDCTQPTSAWKEVAGRFEVVRADQDDAENDVHSLVPGVRLRVDAISGRQEGGRISLRYRLPSSAFEREWGVTVRMEPVVRTHPKGKSTESKVTVRFPAGEAMPRLESDPERRFDHQPLTTKEGWRQLTVLMQEEYVRVLIDGQLRASGRLAAEEPAGRAITSIELFCEPDRRPNRGPSDVAPAPRTTVLVDDVQIQRLCSARTDSPIADAPRDTSQDSLLLEPDRDVLYGTFRSATTKRVEFQVARQPVSVDWKEVRRLSLARRPLTPAPVEGLIARIRLRGPSDRPPSSPPGDALLVAVQAADESTLQVQDAVLGRFALPLAAVWRIEPHYQGVRHVIDPDVHHLGNAVREEFSQPLPEGTQRDVEFFSEGSRDGMQAFIGLATRDVEPCGPNAPPGTPFLAELRAEGLRTEVSLNGASLGDLNSKLTWKAGSADDLAVRLAVPAGALKKGRNVLRIVQRSERRDKESFDDCEVGPVWLELRAGEK